MDKPAPMIAIVDDDPSVRRALNRLVGSAGYLVETFASEAAALASFETVEDKHVVSSVSERDPLLSVELQESKI